MNALKEQFDKEIRQKLQKSLGLKNIMSVPTVEKISVNIGAGDALQNPKFIDTYVQNLLNITGQKPVVVKSKKDVSNFKLRKGNKIGVKVTLRGEKMWDFLEKFTKAVVPRIKDFRGYDTKALDNQGNYSIGIREHNVFLEIDPNKIERLHGLQFTITTSTGNKAYALELLKEIGIPFKK
ncbi:MAG: 50S ribosomal protein L5 [bacterium]